MPFRPHFDNGDNRNEDHEEPKGTRWRLPVVLPQPLVNNPFLKQMILVSIADVLRYVEQENQLMQCFAHVQYKTSSMPIRMIYWLSLIRDATHRGVYGMQAHNIRSQL